MKTEPLIFETLLATKNNAGETWDSYRKSLKPNYYRLFWDLLVCYGALLLGLFLVFFFKEASKRMLRNHY